MTASRDRQITATFVGGPLDGQTRDAPASYCLTDDATPMSYGDANGVLNRPIAAGRPARSGYRSASDGLYVHGSIYCRWADDPTPDEARAVGITNWAWPYGPNISPESRRHLVDWATAGGHRLARSGRECLHWVVGQARRCSALADTMHAGRVNSGGRWDHPTFWTGPEGRFLLAQPYGPPNLTDYDDVRQAWPIEIEISETAPWYGHGTYGVIARPAEAEATR